MVGEDDVVTVTDDLGATLLVGGPKCRVVSLVPSLTESIAEFLCEIE